MAIQDIQVSRFSLKTASEADFADLVALQMISFQERNAGDPLPPEAMLRKNLELMEENPMTMIDLLLARNIEGRLEAMLVMGIPRPDSPDYESQKHVGLVNLFVRPEARRQGIGTLMLRKIVENFQAKGISLIQADTSSDAGRAFAHHFGGTVALETRTNRAYMTEIDWKMLEAWQKDAVEANPDVRIEFIEGLPDEKDLEAYSRLYSEVFSQQPFEELEGMELSFTPERMKEVLAQQAQRGNQEFVMISRETDGAISGLSEIVYNAKRPHMIIQGLTGVQKAYRGRALGKWLKAAMLLHIRETYPNVDYIDTTNASVNEAMLSINERIGFKLYRYNSLFKLQVEEAVKRL